MPLPRSEPVAPKRPLLSGKHGMHLPNSLTIRIFVCMYISMKGRKEMFYLTTTQHILFMAIWRQAYGKGPLR